MRLIQLGGATYQANLLAYLHEKNYNLDLICLDPYKDNPGHLFADISIYKSYTTLESYGYSSRDTLISSFGSDNAEYIFLSSHFGSSVADRDIRRSLLTKSSSRKIFSEVIPESSVSWYESVLNVDQFYDTDYFTRSNILVVKPNISSGSKGVFILRPDEDWSLLKIA